MQSTVSQGTLSIHYYIHRSAEDGTGSAASSELVPTASRVPEPADNDIGVFFFHGCPVRSPRETSTRRLVH